MAREADIHSVQSEALSVGMSALTGITSIPGMLATLIKYGSGGSLEIGGSDLTRGNAYLFTVGEALTLDSSGQIYLLATGATVTAYILRGKSAGI